MQSRNALASSQFLWKVLRGCRRSRDANLLNAIRDHLRHLLVGAIVDWGLAPMTAPTGGLLRQRPGPLEVAWTFGEGQATAD